MNKIFKVIWSKARNCYVVVSEIAHCQGKGKGQKRAVLSCSLAAALTVFTLTGGITAVQAAQTINITEESPGAQGSTNEGTYSTVIGPGAKNKSNQSEGVIVIGHNAIVDNNGSPKDSIAIGTSANVVGENNIAIGTKAAVTNNGGNNAISLGTEATAEKSESIAIGMKAHANNNDGIAAIAIGSGSQAQKDKSIAIGYKTLAENNGESGGIAIGSSIVDSQGNIITQTKAAQGNDIAFGVGAQTDNNNMNGHNGGAVAIGHLSYSKGYQDVAIGDNAKTGRIGTEGEGYVAIGANSFSNVGPGVVGYDFQTKRSQTNEYAAVWKSTNGAVSVGNVSDGDYTKWITRQITGVAAGSADTDAVNVAQLKAAISSVNTGDASSTSGDGVHFYSVNETDSTKGNYDNKGASGTDSLAAGVDAKTSGNYATAVGNNAKALGDNAVALGNGAMAEGNGATVIGQYAKATGRYALAFGGQQTDTSSVAANNVASGDNSVAFGERSTASGSNSTAFGQGTQATEKRATAFGQRTQATQSNATAFGIDTLASGQNATAFGNLTQATAIGATAFGNKNQATGQYATAWGGGDKVVDNGDGTTSKIGTVASGTYATAFGERTVASGESATAFGSDSIASGKDSLAFGTGSKASGNNSLAGLGGTATTANSIALGNNTKANNKDNAVSVAIGENAEASGERSLAIGFGVSEKVNGQDDTTLTSTKASGESAIAIGTDVVAKGQHSVAMGSHTDAAKDSSVAIGFDTHTVSDSAVAIGSGTRAEGRYSVALGLSSVAGKETNDAKNPLNGGGSVAIGYGTSAEASRSIAIGTGATAADSQFTTAVGDSTIAQAEGSVAIGAGSIATRGAGNKESTASTDVNTGKTTITYGDEKKAYLKPDELSTDKTSTWVSTTGAVSVGGQATYKEYDDNGNLVKKTKLLTRQITNVAAGSDDTDAVNVAQLKAAQPTVTSNDHSVTIDTTTDKTDYHKNYDLKIATATLSQEKTGTGDSAVETGKVTVTNPKISVTENGETKQVDNPNAYVTGKSVADAINNSGFKLTASASEGAVTGNKETLIHPGDIVTIDAGKNISLTQDKGKISIATKDNLNLGSADSKDDKQQDVPGTNGSITVNGKNGSSVAINGQDGSIGLTGPKGTDGTSTSIQMSTIMSDPTLDDSKNTKTTSGEGEQQTTTTQAPRIQYKNGNTTYEVATMDDGQKYAGDVKASDAKANAFSRKLNEQTNIVGGVKNLDALSTGNNVGVVSNGTDTLTIRLAKELTDLTSVTTVKKDAKGNKTSETVQDGNGITITPTTLGGGKSSVSLTDKGLSNGGNQITHVDSGLKDATGNTVDLAAASGDMLNNAVNVGDLQKVQNVASAHTAVTVNGGVGAPDAEADGNLGSYTDKEKGNLLLAQKKDTTTGQITYDLKLNDNVILGKDGSDGKDGQEGTIGLTGKDGVPGADGKQEYSTTIIKTEKGQPGADGKNGKPGVDGTDITRIVYTDKDGSNPQTVATMDDGQKYGGDNYVAATDKAAEQNVITKKLNERLDIQGGADKDKLTEQNIGVNVKDGVMKVQLAQNLNLTGNGSVTMGNTIIDNGGVTITTKNGDNTNTISLTDNGLNNGGKTITNVADGTNPTDAVNVSQLNAAKTTVTSNDHSVTIDTTTDKTDYHKNYDLKIATATLSQEKTGTGDKPVETGKVTVANPTYTENGQTVENKNAYVTGNSVADAINNSGFKLTASASEGDVTGNAETLIHPGDTMTIDAGKNISLTQDKGKISIATKDNLNLGSADSKDDKQDVPGTNGSITVNGRNGSSVAINGQDGSIGLTGPKGTDGTSTSIQMSTIMSDPTLDDGKNTKTTSGEGEQQTTTTQAPRIQYKNGNTTYEVATMDDGQKYAGDVQASDAKANAFSRKLNEQTNIVGGVKNLDALSTGNNVGVVSNGTDTLTIRLAKELTDLTSVTTVTKDAKGNKMSETVQDGNGITITPTTLGEGKSSVSLTDTGLSNGGNQITHVDSGLKNATGNTVDLAAASGDVLNNAVNVGDLQNVQKVASAHTAVTVNGGVGAPNAEADGNLGSYTDKEKGNLLLAQKKDNTGKITYDLKLNDNVILGKDTSDGKDGQEGTIGLTGKDGLPGADGKQRYSTTIIRTEKGQAGKDSKTGKENLAGTDMTRIVYTDKDGGNPQTVATLSDGLKFAGDDISTTVDKKLNDTLQIRGDGTYDKEKNTIADDGNIKTSVDNGAVKVSLSDKINLHQDGSLTVGGGSTTGDDPIIIKHFDAGKLTVTGTDKDGKTPQSAAGDYVTGLDNKDWNVDKPEYVSGRAATEDQLKAISDTIKANADAAASQHTEITVNDKANPTSVSTENIGQDGYGNYAGTENDNLLIAAKKDATSNKVTYNIKLNDQLAIGKNGTDGQDGKDGKVTVETSKGTTVVIGHDGEPGKDGKDGISVKGQDGKDGVTISAVKGQNGSEGHIGLAGPKGADGKNADIDISTKMGKGTLDRNQNEVKGEYKDGTNDQAARIQYQTTVTGTDGKPKTITHEVATMDDGLKFVGNDGQEVTRKLNETLSITGGLSKTDVANASTKNLGVRSNDKGDGLEIVMTDTPDFTKVTVGGDNKITIGGQTNSDTKNPANGNYITGLDNTQWDKNHVTENRAATEGQLKEAINEISGKDKGGFGLAAEKGGSVQQDLGGTITVKGDTIYKEDGKTVVKEGNIKTSVDDGAIKVELNKNVDLGQDGSIKAGETTIDEDGVKTNEVKVGDITITKDGINGGTKQITNIGSGIDGKQYADAKDNNAASIGDVKKIAGDEASKAAEAVKSKSGKNITVKDDHTVNLNDHITLGDDQDKTKQVAIDGNGAKVTAGDGTNKVTVDGSQGQVTIGSEDKTLTLGKQANGAGDGNPENGNYLNGLDNKKWDGEHIQNGRAATEDQLKTVSDKVNSGRVFQGDDGKEVKVGMGDTLKIQGGVKAEDVSKENNIGIVKGADDTLNIRLAKDLKGLDSVTTGNTTIDNGGLTVKTGDSSHQDITIKQGNVNMGGNKIEGVAPGKVSKDSTDAVNGSQLWQRDQAINGLSGSVNKLGNRINRVGAGAAALAALHPLDFDPDDKWDFAAGYGNYRGANAAAVGAYYRPNEDTMFSVGGSFGGGENMVNAGVSIKLGQGNHVSTSRVAMAKEIKDLRQNVANLNAIVNRQSALIDKLTGTNAGMIKDKGNDLFPDVPANHWAYEYVTKLKHAGILTGYPDGNFDGDRMMTRYEFAAIVYRAIMAGAASNPALNQDGTLDKLANEFSSEMKYIRIDTIQKDRDGKPTIERVRVISDAK